VAATTLPPAPASISATSTYDNIVLNWSSVTGAGTYTVYRGTVSGGPYTAIASGLQGLTFADSAVLTGATYYYVVSAVDVGGAGPFSAEVSAKLFMPWPTLTWDSLGANPTNPVDGSATWNTTAALWSSGTADSTWDNSGNYIAVFGNSGTAGTVTVGAIKSRGVIFNPTASGAYTLTSGTLALSGSAPLVRVDASATISAVLSSTAAVTIDGTAAITLTAPAALSAGATLQDATLSLSGPSFGVMLGSGTLSFAGGTLVNLTGGNNTSYFKNPVFVPTGENGNIIFSNRTEWTAPSVTGNGILNLYISSTTGGSRDDFYTDFSTYGGQVNLIGTLQGCGLRYFLINGGARGSASAVWNIGGSGTSITFLPQTNSTGNTMDMGALTGGTAATLGGGTGGVATYSIGAIGDDSTFPGRISGNAAVTKIGSGTLLLSGSSAYTGATSVQSGVLQLTGSISSTNSLTVASGAVFHLAGGSLSVFGTVTNNGLFKISGAPALAVTGSFINNGVLDLINSSSALPPNFINRGAILDSGDVAVGSVSMSGTGVTISIQSYVQHSYQLLRTSSLANPSWTMVGSPQTGNGSILKFSDSAGLVGKQGFYRIQVGP
jgi:autotransporter-associated beta strand protein